MVLGGGSYGNPRHNALGDQKQSPAACASFCEISTPGAHRESYAGRPREKVDDSRRPYYTIQIILYYIILYNTILYTTLLCTTLLYSTILYYTILYYAILYYTILYYTILYYTILYYTILYYTILYYTILYYTILYYTILYYTRIYYTLSYHILQHQHRASLKTDCRSQGQPHQILLGHTQRLQLECQYRTIRLKSYSHIWYGLGELLPEGPSIAGTAGPLGP